MRTVELAVQIAADVSGDVGAKLGGVASDLDNVGEAADRSSGHLDRVGGAAEGLDDKFGRTTGAAGALASGFDLIGNEKASEALGKVALATDFLSGVGQVGILVTELFTAATAESEAATVSNTIAQKGAAVASKAWAGALAVLNAVLEANPILLVVVAIAALVAGLVLAYKHSETFRNAVQAAGRIGREALGWVVDKVSDVIDWFQKGGGAAEALRRVIGGEVALIKGEIQLVVDVVSWLVHRIGDVGDKFGELKDDAVDAAEFVRDKVGAAFHKLLGPIQDAIDAAQTLFGWLGKDDDKAQGLNPPGSNIPDAGPPPTHARSVATPPTAVNVKLTVDAPPLSDPSAVAAAVVKLLTDYFASTGNLPPWLTGTVPA